MSTASQFKNRVKYLVKYAYSLKCRPSTAKVKKIFFEYDLRKHESWQEIADICNERLDMLERSAEKFAKAEIAKEINTIVRKYNAYTDTIDYLGSSVSVRCFYNRMKLGTISVDYESGDVLYYPTNYLKLKASNVDEAVQLMLQRRGVSLVSALGIA